MDISGSDYNTGFQTLRMGTLRTGFEGDMLYNSFLEQLDAGNDESFKGLPRRRITAQERRCTTLSFVDA